jgi:hypothetical protein
LIGFSLPNSAPGILVFTLPVADRPTNTQRISVNMGTSSGVEDPNAVFQINTNGEVRMYSQQGLFVGSNEGVSVTGKIIL